jgi:hypothetical protein
VQELVLGQARQEQGLVWLVLAQLVRRERPVALLRALPALLAPLPRLQRTPRLMRTIQTLTRKVLWRLSSKQRR